MKLILSLTGAAPLDGANDRCVLEAGRCVIGRSPDADWQLPDPARIISKIHCRIEALPHGFVLTDVSTNGTFINDEAVGFEGKRLLVNGDRLRFGRVEVAVAVEKQQPAAATAMVRDGPFGDEVPEPSAHKTFMAHEAASTEPAPPAVAKASGEPRESGPIEEDWWLSPAPGGPAKGVDSADRPYVDEARTVLASDEPISATDAIVISLVQSFPSLDVLSLASAVDAAGARIPEDEWQRFYQRLRAILQEKHPDDRQTIAGRR